MHFALSCLVFHQPELFFFFSLCAGPRGQHFIPSAERILWTFQETKQHAEPDHPPLNYPGMQKVFTMQFVCISKHCHQLFAFLVVSVLNCITSLPQRVDLVEIFHHFDSTGVLTKFICWLEGRNEK